MSDTQNGVRKLSHIDQWGTEMYNLGFADCRKREVQPLREVNADLLAALIDITEAAQSWHDFHHGTEDIQCDDICKALPKAKVAIRKAKGEA